jgi:hypothetical protein
MCSEFVLELLDEMEHRRHVHGAEVIAERMILQILGLK